MKPRCSYKAREEELSTSVSRTTWKERNVRRIRVSEEQIIKIRRGRCTEKSASKKIWRERLK